MLLAVFVIKMKIQLTEKSLSALFLKNQKKCKVSREQIDPTDEQVMNAYDELIGLPIDQQKIRCRTADKQIKAHF